MNTQLLLESSTKGRPSYVLPFAQIGMADIATVGGKNASLGEMTSNLAPLGIRVPNGFALSTEAFWDFIAANNLKSKIQESLASLDRKTYSNLHEVGEACRGCITLGSLPKPVEDAIVEGYRALAEGGILQTVAVRSSATAEDL